MPSARVMRTTIDNYLIALQARQVSGDSSEAIDQAIHDLQARIILTASPADKLEMIAARRALERDLDVVLPQKRFVALEQKFVGVAREWGESKGIDWAAWREIGVPAEVLASAGIRPDGSPATRPVETVRVPGLEIKGIQQGAMWVVPLTTNRDAAKLAFQQGMGRSAGDSICQMFRWGLEHWRPITREETQPMASTTGAMLPTKVALNQNEWNKLTNLTVTNAVTFRGSPPDAMIKRMAMTVCLQDHELLRDTELAAKSRALRPVGAQTVDETRTPDSAPDPC